MLSGGFEGNQTLYIRVRSFGVDIKTKMTEFLTEAADLFFHEKAKRLVLDLRGNSGGNIDWAMEFLSFFFPQTVPLHLLYHLRKEPIFERADSFRYSKDWVNPSSFESYLDTLLWYPGYSGSHLFAPHSVLVLTDGNCGSACAQVVKKIKQAHAAKVIGVGSAPLARDLREDKTYLESLRSRYEIGGFAGGYLSTYDFLLQNRSRRVVSFHVCSNAASLWDEDDNSLCLVIPLSV